jgi:hypothetical protein
MLALVAKLPYLTGVIPVAELTTRPLMRPHLILMLVVLGACATQDAVAFSGKARFSSYPDALFDALEQACGTPAQSFTRPTKDSVECREFLPPESTAAIILQFDGTTTDLPQLVIRFQAQRENQDYLVENQFFLHVPQKSGPPLRMQPSDSRYSRKLNALYKHAGGMPE